MSYLRKAVNLQRKYLIARLIQEGIYPVHNKKLYRKSTNELIDEYQQLRNNKKQQISK
ncbi:Fur-regulated basic protein FbpA [Aquibacillus sediminis]|uniref:Fur-regulated basic protein FbpA n=1 Tax=Aquibacillus sediminis TaxID=2574734 RepID=UPI001109A817|nr:Fur-regulated basic protein FbpA [Aquibacillus sediminis]